MSEPTRRWPRVPVDMPVRVVTSKGFSTTVVEGRGTELSEGGMVLYAGILLNPGDLLEVEFDTPNLSRVPAIVRSRNGFCFGLEFIPPLPAESTSFPHRPDSICAGDLFYYPRQ